MKEFAVLQLSGCAGCEVALLNADAWMDSFQLAYMPLVISAYDVPAVDLLMVSGAVHTDEDDLNLRHAVQRTRRQGGQVIAVGTCAISGGVANLGNRDDVRQLFLAEAARSHAPRLLDKSSPIDSVVAVDLYLPGARRPPGQLPPGPFRRVSCTAPRRPGRGNAFRWPGRTLASRP
jgi:F420-non-reducing hydrogenase small subunit